MTTAGYRLCALLLPVLLLVGGVQAGLLLDTRGEVLLKRQPWPAFYAVREGVQLYHGDLLQLASDARALILCGDFMTLWSPASGELSGPTQGCPATPRGPLIRFGQLALASRSQTESTLPYIITPRNTAISDPQPFLRWNAVPGTRQYVVRVIDSRKPGTPLWGPVAVQATSLHYPTEAPALHPGVTYLLHVETDQRRGSPTTGVGFRLISETQQELLARHREGLRRKLTQGAARQLALAMYYLSSQLRRRLWKPLRSEALELLDTLVQNSNSAPVHLLRASVLLDTQLIQAAADQFERARRLAEQQQDRESQAQALVGLALTAQDEAQVGQHYRDALALYEALGEHQRAGELRTKLSALP